MAGHSIQHLNVQLPVPNTITSTDMPFYTAHPPFTGVVHHMEITKQLPEVRNADMSPKKHSCCYIAGRCNRPFNILKGLALILAAGQ